MRRIRNIAMVLAVVALAAACSYVFTGYIDGIVEDSSGNPVGGADVYLFSSYDSLQKALSDTSKVTGYYDKTTSLSVSRDGSSILPEGETGGAFSFGVIWESRNPEFGEDYDRRMFYVLAVAPDGKKGWAEANVSSLSGSPKYVAVTVE